MLPQFKICLISWNVLFFFFLLPLLSLLLPVLKDSVVYTPETVLSDLYILFHQIGKITPCVRNYWYPNFTGDGL